MGAVAVAAAQSCCEPVLQSNAELWGSYFALNNAAVHWCCITAHLHGEQIFIGVVAVAHLAVSLFCRATLNSGEAILPRTVL